MGIGAAVEDYLKEIYKLSIERERVTHAMVAEGLSVSPPAVTKMVKRLREMNLSKYDRGRGLALTPKGQRIALEVLRHHRLIELYLHDQLGFSWDEVHEEAERLEHVISERFEERIAELLGYPSHDPHGDPIPTRDGKVDTVDEMTLVEMRNGSSGKILRVYNQDSEMLRYMGKLGLYPGVRVKRLDAEPYGGSLRISVADKEIRIGRELAGHIYFAREEER